MTTIQEHAKKEEEKEPEEKEQSIYRYNFKEEFMIELYNFSKIHQYDHRKDFKDAWDKWIIENNELVQVETRRLFNLNYNGNVSEKMFTSARYYFRKKSPEKKEKKNRKIYINVDKKLIYAMDAYILTNISYKPSITFLEFCKINMDILTKEFIRLSIENMKCDEIKNKIKKTYKNRYFIHTNKM